MTITLPNAVALSVQAVTDHIGINHHIDFGSEPALPLAIAAVNYLGIKHIRDCADNPNTLGPSGTWQQMANGTGAKFCAFMTGGGVNVMTRDLPWAQQLAAQGIIELVEGGNEEDNAYAVGQGNSIAITQTFQQQVFAAGRALNVPVVNMSFGSGWTAANNWHGDYDKVGDMSPFCDYANAHTYPAVGRPTGSEVRTLRNDALLAAPSRQVIHTELGWNNSQFNDFAGIGRFAVQGILDSIRDGNFRVYFYAIFDDGSGKFGFFNSDGTPRPAATAIHNLTTILADNGAPRNDTLAYTASGTTANDNILLLQKSNGSFMFAIWNESADAAHPVTVTLGSSSGWNLYDPTVSATASALPAGPAATAWIGNRPMILEAVTSASVPVTPPVVPPPVTDPVPPPVVVPPPPVVPPVTDPVPPPVTDPVPPPVVVPPVVVPPVVVPPVVPPPPAPNPAWIFPASLFTTGTIPLAGISISDPYADGHAGLMGLFVTTNKGVLSALDATGAAVPGSGTVKLSYSASFAKVNAALATLTLGLAGPGIYTLTFDIWDQAGVEKKTVKTALTIS